MRRDPSPSPGDLPDLEYLDPSLSEWHPTSVLLPGESHGSRSLVGCSPWGHKELDRTQRLNHSNNKPF